MLLISASLGSMLVTIMSMHITVRITNTELPTTGLQNEGF